MWFIDKLNIHQDHADILQVVGSEMVVRIDISTGETLSESPKSKSIEGSFSSTLTVRCNGNRVSVTGNPSRWNRTENLFGFAQLSDCVAVYNQVLLSLGLPVFTPCTEVSYRAGSDGKKVELVSDGAIIDHIDFTRNFSVSSGAETAFIRALSTQSIGKGKEPYLYPNQCTVDWYKGSTTRYIKVYVKEADLSNKKHIKKRLKNATPEEVDYYNKVKEYCVKEGVLREEHSFKRAWLSRKKLNLYGLISEEAYLPYLNEISDIVSRLQVMNINYETIAEQLILEKIVKSPQAANATQAVAMKWLHGMKIPKKSQYYEHRSRLLRLGIDISIPYDASKPLPQIRSNQVIEINYLTPPHWYRLPNRTTLRMVA